jgi:hypothetical protein
MPFTSDDELKLFDPGSVDVETSAFNKKRVVFLRVG